MSLRLALGFFYFHLVFLEVFFPKPDKRSERHEPSFWLQTTSLSFSPNGSRLRWRRKGNEVVKARLMVARACLFQGIHDPQPLNRKADRREKSYRRFSSFMFSGGAWIPWPFSFFNFWFFTNNKGIEKPKGLQAQERKRKAPAELCASGITRISNVGSDSGAELQASR